MLLLCCMPSTCSLKMEKCMLQLHVHRDFTFHYSKAYRGTPIKSTDLQLVNGQNHRFSFDPRPPKYANAGNFSYKDYFQNTCLNATGVSTTPIFQLFKPANPYAVAHDHDYCFDTMQNDFLSSISLPNITQEKRTEIEHTTRGQTGNAAWFEERCKRLTSSNFGRICKATDKTDFRKLVRSSTTVTKIKCAPIRHGQRCEKIALAKYEETNNVNTRSSGLVVSLTHPYLAASPDAVVDDNLLVEIKCPYVARERSITPVNVPYLVQDSYSDELKLLKQHNYQVQGQLFCTGATMCDFTVFTFKDMKVIRIMRDDEFIKDMLKCLENFFQSHFRTAVYSLYSWS
ncbi:PREDICTED: uncharacterized protein LOC106807441 [Priapulus caudatus]|uniref:Uncharacterized protein LOC106807441 n=1 Tax=Priapulus caudatus TaxID=37621 RepID=A0ABM1DZ82_PRICU|nr:PREDICTED: uncharacterized protein LOC106807441 [Priapulus caudatus]